MGISTFSTVTNLKLPTLTTLMKELPTGKEKQQKYSKYMLLDPCGTKEKSTYFLSWRENKNVYKNKQTKSYWIKYSVIALFWNVYLLSFLPQIATLLMVSAS